MIFGLDTWYQYILTIAGIKDNCFRKFTGRLLGSKELKTVKDQTLEKTKEFIEKNPQIIDQLSPESTNNLFSNLDLLLEVNPFCKDTIIKIKKSFNVICFRKFTGKLLGSEELKTVNDQTLEKTKEFIEKNPQIIDQLSTESTNNLFSNLNLLLEVNPFCKNTILKMKNSFNVTLVGEDIDRFLDKLKKYQNLNSDHLRELIQTFLEQLNPQKLHTLLMELTRDIQKHGIINEQARIEIAKIAAAQDGWNISKYIKEYGITDQSALTEIAKIVASQNGWIVSEYIKNYGITDQSALIEIAKIAANQSGESVSRQIRNYGITNRRALIEIAEIAIISSPLNILQHLGNFFLDWNFESTPAYKLWLFRVLAYGLSGAERDSLAIFRSFEKFSPLLENGLSQQENETTLKEFNAKEFFERCMQRFESQLPSDLKKISPCKQALNYRNYPLIGIFISESFEPAYQKAYQSLAKTTVTPRLPSILPAKWMSEGNIQVPPKEFLDFFTRFKHKLKDKDSHLMQMYLLSAQALDKFPSISSARKLDLLSSICNHQENELEKVLEGLSYLYSFCMRGQIIRSQIEVLNTLDLKDPITSCKEALENMLSKDPFVRISDIPNFATLYRNSFDQTRIPLAIEIYKAKLSTLKDEATRATLERLIRSVLLENFNEERFRTDISPHLAKIEEKHSTLLEAWKYLEFSAPVASSTTEAEQTRFSFRNFFETKLQDEHWKKDGKDLLPDLTAYLGKRPIEDPPSAIVRLCKELIENEALSEEEQIGKIQEIVTALTASELGELELKADLEGLITNLRAQRQPASNETVILSKDWQDLFLAGTEVQGSCQRIDGNPALNKCLLAYCMDGKNAMIAVKNKKEKLLARSMLRLLWNEQEQKPALFLDRLYPYPCPSERQAAIARAAIECAKKLNCDLFTHWAEYPDAPGVTINSLQGPCPYEYADGAEGVMPKGIFQISNLRKVHSAILTL